MVYTARMLKLCISGEKQELRILYYKVGWLFTFKNKKKKKGEAKQETAI